MACNGTCDQRWLRANGLRNSGLTYDCGLFYVGNKAQVAEHAQLSE